MSSSSTSSSLRTPLGKKTNASSQTGLSSFRRSLLPAPSGALSVARKTQDTRTDTQTKRKKVTFGMTTEKENATGTSTRSSATSTTRAPSKVNASRGISGLRQSLRATLSPVTTSSIRRVTTPMATTPNSLLKNELNLTENVDESLLFSPLPKPPPASRNSSRRLGPPLPHRQPKTHQSTKVPLKKEQSLNVQQPKSSVPTKEPSKKEQSLQNIQPKSTNEKEDNSCTKKGQSLNVQQPKSTVLSQEPSKRERSLKVQPKSSVPTDATATNEKEENSRRSIIAKQPMKSTEALETFSSKPLARSSVVNPSPIVDPVQKKPVPPTTLLESSNSNSKSLRVVLPTVMRDPARAATAATPLTTPRYSTKRNAVCMDLSDMFLNVSSSAKPPPSTSARPAKNQPSSSVRKVQTHNNITSSTTITAATTAANDQDWAEKQCETVTKWLNYTLQPTEDDQEAALERDDDKTDNDGRSTTSEDRRALRMLVLHQRMAKARSRALELFNSNEMGSIRRVIESEIARGRLSIRKDRNLYADLTVRKQIIDLLLSYSTPWLRLGLETLFGEPILPEAPQHFSSPAAPPRVARLAKKPTKIPLSRMKVTLKNFIIQRVLSDEIILAKYTKGLCKVPSGKFEVKYQAEMRTIVLYRLLVLFFFLDRAKEANILDKAPRLFMNDAPVKSSQQVLLAFCRDFLSAEGNFVKHLARVGLKVFYKQGAIEELDFTITNLAVDLRDGVRLARMTEILTGSPRKSMLSSLRLPAVSRLQKLHNVELVIQALRKFGVPISSDIAAHHIVDGHREIVLKLMWSVVAHCCLKDLLDVEKVRAETKRIERETWRRNGKSTDMVKAPTPPVPDTTSLLGNDELKGVLLRWCQAVCHSFGLQMNDLTNDFADGRAACLLIHYYHPNLLRLHEIKQTTRDLPTVPVPSQERSDAARVNERFNATLANTRMSELGGIPQMVPVSDTTRIPDEKSMLLCLSFMCSRLLESNGEVRSCVIIQKCYRKYRRAVDMKKKVSSARIILEEWGARKHSYYLAQRCKYGGAVRIIESFVASHSADLKRLKVDRLANENLHNSAIVLQKHLRRILAQQHYISVMRQARAATVCQSQWRRFETQRGYKLELRQQQAATLIGRIWRDIYFRRNDRSFAAVQIQRVWRGYWALLQYQIDLMDVIAVQSCIRRWLAKRFRHRRLRAARAIQNVAKKHLRMKQIKHDTRRFFAAVKCQLTIRRYLASKHVAVLKEQSFAAAILIQSHCRRYMVNLQVIKMHQACRIIQAHTRARQERANYKIIIESILIIQASWRRAASQKLFARSVLKIVICQKYIRMRVASFEADRRRKAVLVLQCAMRRMRARQHLLTLKQELKRIRNAVVIIQRFWRGFAAFARFRLLVANVVTVQSAFRRVHASISRSRRLSAVLSLQYQARRFLAQLALRRLRAEQRRRNNLRNKSVIKIQSCYRGYLVQREVKHLQHCALSIQRVYRGFSAWITFQMDLMDIILVQSLVRRWRAQRKVQYRMDSLFRLQAVARRHLARKRAFRVRAAVQELNRKQESSTAIQRVFRGHISRRLSSKEAAARKIQKTWRCYTVHVDFMLSILAAIEIQRHIRRYLFMNDLKKKLAGVAVIQAFGRRLLRQLRKARINRSATTVQTLVRMYLARDDFVLQKMAAVQVQRWVRGHLARIEREIESFAACEIQRIWRGYDAYADFVWSLLSVMKIQRALRAFLAKRKAHRIRMDLLAAEILETRCALKIQHSYRGFVHRRKLNQSAERIQAAVRFFLSKRSFTKLRRGITRAQSLARGHYARRHRSKEMKAQISRIEHANKKAEQEPKLRLGNRTAAALEVLQRSTRLAEIMTAICTLEISTRLSKVCCAAFADAGAPDILFSLIRTCNRSLPHVELLHYILLTMSNVAQHDALLPSMATVTGVEVFLDLVQMFRDKDGVFFLAATLLERVVRCSDDFQNLCGSKENLKRLKGVNALCMRKLSISGGNNRLSLSRESLYRLPNKKRTKRREDELRRGVKALQRVIRLVDTVPVNEDY